MSCRSALYRPACPSTCRSVPPRPRCTGVSFCFCLYRTSAPLVALIELGVSKLIGKLPSLVCSTPKGRDSSICCFTDFEVFVHALIAPCRVVPPRTAPPAPPVSFRTAPSAVYRSLCLFLFVSHFSPSCGSHRVGRVQISRKASVFGLFDPKG